MLSFAEYIRSLERILGKQPVGSVREDLYRYYKLGLITCTGRRP